MSVKLGFQLSSVTPYLDTPERLRCSFRRLAEIGYRDVQLQGVPTEMQDDLIAEALADAGLNCVATQEDYPFGFGVNPERAIARAVRCGARYLCCALIPREVDTPEKLQRFADKLGDIEGKVRAAGLIFTFHPIAPDLRDMDGQPVFERLMALLPGDVQLTFCVNAAFGAGNDPMPILAKYAGRVDLVHFKDDALMPDGGRHLMPLGQGTHDWALILQACNQAGAKYAFAEQERWLKDAFDCAKDSFEYLVCLGM
jgi:sugar phosphate isomerase/epimerase